MSVAPWRSLVERALHRNRSLPESRYFQLATLGEDHRPRNRTVVFRGFLDGSDQLKIVTDARSQKAEQIPRQPWGEVCWYFAKTREQFRIAGELKLIGESDRDPQWQQARQSAWQQLSDAARSQFAWPDPRTPRATQEAFQVSPPAAEFPLTNFCLLLLDPVQVDFLELRGEPQNRWLHQRQSDRSWSKQAVNP